MVHFAHGQCFLLCLVIRVSRATLSCDFDFGLCQWQQSKTDQFDWRVTDGPTPDATSGPLADHTSGNGKYAYVRGEDAMNGNSHGVLVSPFVNVSTHSSVSFWHYMNGNGIGTLSLKSAPLLGPKRILWSLSGRQGNLWKQEHILLPVGPYQLEFEATAAHHYGSDLAIDDVTLTPEPTEILGITRPTYMTVITTTTTTTTTPSTPTTTTPLTTLTCAFEKDFCLWTQDRSDNFDWRRTKGQTDDRSSGPLGDHTTEHGYYAYIRGSDSKHLDEFARLESPSIDSSSTSNMTFWYHMNGGGIGSLKVIRMEAGGRISVLFSANGRQGPNWHHGVVSLKPGIFKIIIEATASLHYGSDIAIDDILSSVFKQAPLPTAATTMTMLTTTERLPTTCTFERNTCGWSQYGDANLDWIRGKGNTPDSVSGPTGDHTTSHGYYMFLNGRQAGNSRWTADFISQELDIHEASTLSLWYYMNGPNIGMLVVLKLTPDGGVTTLWRRVGRQASDWLQGRVALVPGKYKLVISASARQHYGSDLAIDDVTLMVDSNNPIISTGLV